VSVVTDYGDIAGYGIMKTPGLVVDEEVLVYGCVPKPAEIAELLSARS
jgi:Thioredoxin domain